MGLLPHRVVMETVLCLLLASACVIVLHYLVRANEPRDDEP